MSRASRTVLTDQKTQRTRSIMSFRQYLLPKDTNDLQPNTTNNYQINPKALAAIADQCEVQPPLTFNQRVVRVYKMIGGSIRPQEPTLVFWKVLLVLIIVYYIIQIGLIFGFGQAFWQDQLSYLFGLHIAFIIILFVDILISPFKAFYDEGLLIKDISVIYKKYVRLQLWLDLLALVSIIIPLAVNNINANWVKLAFLVKLYSMGNIIGDLERMTQLYIIPNTIFLIIKLIIYSYFYSHYMGIFFYKISLYIYETNYYGPNTPNIVWIYNSWAFYQMAFLPWYLMYSYIMYFSIAVVTTIAYGDITPKNPLQCIYIIWGLTFQTIIWGYILSEILRLLLNVYSYNFSRRYHHYSLNFKLKTNLVSDSIFKKVQIHTEQIDREQQYRNREIQQEILDFLPADPLYGMLLVIYKDYLYKMGFQFANRLSYKSLGPADQKSLFLQTFMKCIREARHFAGDVLYLQGQIEGAKPQNHCAYCYTNSSYSQSVVLGVGEHIQIRTEGDNSVRANKGAGRLCFQLKRPKKTFGQVQFLNGEQRSHWAICVKNCLLFYVPRKALQDNYHLLTLQEKEVVVLNAEKARERACLICRSRHEFKQCPFVFVAFGDNMIDVGKKSARLPLERTEYRTRLKSLSSWRLFTSIRAIKMNITKAYKDRIFYDKSAHELFAQLQLEEELAEEEKESDIEQEMYETQVVIESIYRQELEELGLSEQHWTSDKIHTFKYYKPPSNVEQVAVSIQKNREARKQRRNVRL